MKDGSAYNLQWRGARPVFIDIGSFEPARDGRAVGRLPPVLPDHALPAAAAGPPRPGLPAVAAGPDRRHRARPDAPALRRHPAAAARRAQARPPARRDAVPASPSDSTGAVRDRAARTRASPASWPLATVRALRKLVGQARLAAAGDALGRLPARPAPTPTDDRAAKAAFVDAALAGGATRPGPGAGPRRQRRRLLPAWPPSTPTTWSRSRPTRRVVDRLYRDAARRGRAADPAAGHGPGRPVAGRRLAAASSGRRFASRRGAADAVLALARRPPPRDRPQRAAARGGRLARRSLRPAGVVVEFVAPGRPDGAAAAGQQAGRAVRRLPPRRVRAAARRSGCTIERREELPSGTRTLYAGVRRD